MRVLHVLDISVPTLAGYSTRSRYIVNNQKAVGLDPVVVTSARHENPSQCAMEEIDGIRYYRTLAPRAGPFMDALAQKPGAGELLEINRFRQRIVEVAQREEPDIIHGHSSILCGIPALLAARELGIPCVYEIRAFWEDAAVDLGRTEVGSKRYMATQHAETLLAKQVDAVVAICQGIKGELVQRGLNTSNIHVVPNGVEVDRFVPIPLDVALKQKYGFEGKTVVGYIGTFHSWEGVRFLVEALVKLIKGGRDDIRGLIVGAGRTYEACAKIARDAGLEKEILHPGRVPHSEVNAVYSVVDVLAYPRDRQRITELVTPLKPLEAMAMEKAVIGSDVGGITELITDQRTGLIHRAEDVADLSEKILTLVDDPVLRAQLGKQGREYVCENRRWRKIIEEHFDLYETAKDNWRRRQFLYKGIAKVLEPVRTLGL
jgi:glycogen(starch) synthase